MLDQLYKQSLSGLLALSLLGLNACANLPTQQVASVTPISPTNILGLQGFSKGGKIKASGPFFTSGEGQVLEIAPQQLRIQLNYRTPMGGGFALQNGQISLDIDVQSGRDGVYLVNLSDLYAQKAYSIPNLQKNGSCLTKNSDGQNIEFCFTQSQPGQISLRSSLLSGMTLNIWED